MSGEDQAPGFRQPPKPPSHTDTHKDPAPTFAWIESRIAEFYAVQQVHHQQINVSQLNMTAYLDTYSAIHQFCTCTRHGRAASGQLNGESLYRSLESAIKTYCREVSTAISALKDEESATSSSITVAVLSEYSNQWNTFTRICEQIEHIFQFLERHWIKREVDESQPGIYLLRNLHNRIWGYEVLGVTWPSAQPAAESRTTSLVVDVVKQLQQLDENNFAQAGSDGGLVQGALDSFSSLGLEFVDGSFKVQPEKVEPVSETAVEQAVTRHTPTLEAIVETGAGNDKTQDQ